MSINLERAATLLHVIEKGLGHPKLKWLVEAATAELEKMEPKVEEPKPMLKAEAPKVLEPKEDAPKPQALASEPKHVDRRI